MVFQMAKTENWPFSALIDCICQIQIFFSMLFDGEGIILSIWLGYYQQWDRLFSYLFHTDKNRCLNIYYMNKQETRPNNNLSTFFVPRFM